jgi:citrate synthase
MSKGLEDVVASTSAITFIDGTRGRLLYRGYDINDLVQHSNYEEVAYLLLHERLPKPAELAAFSADLSSKRSIPPGVKSILDSLSHDCDTMDAVEMAIAALGIYDDPTLPLNEKAVSIASKISTIVAYIHRHRHRLPHLEPKADLSQSANLLYLVNGLEPDEFSEKMMNMVLVVHADHELNASTFTARVVASTLSDAYSSVTAAVAALKGPLHGGANERVVEMVAEIGSPANVESYVRQKLARKEKIMGFGHRVYKTLDPRAKIMLECSERIASTDEERNELAVLERVQEFMLKEKGLYPNVDLYSGFVLNHLGIPTDLFTPVFAVARAPGWLAHIIEQYSDNRIMRPIAHYTGPRDERYVPILLRAGSITN